MTSGLTTANGLTAVRVGTLASQDASSVTITGGTITGLSSPIPVPSGGTGRATFATRKIIVGNSASGLLATDVSVSAGTLSNYQAKIQTKSDSYGLVSADTGSVIYFTNSSAAILTCPKTMPVGFTIQVIQHGTAQVTFTAGASAAVFNRRTQTKTAGQYAACSLTVILNADGSNSQYILAGDTGV